MVKHDALIGLTLGQYEIVDIIGKGGMATVYRAYQKSVNRTVALKVLPRNFTHDDTFMSRFRREAEVIAQLEHPHILPIHDYGEYDDMPYIVMRHVEGGNLHDRIYRRDLSFEEIVRITSQVASALDYAHARNVIHRDVKPSNILLSEGNAYLSDFGLARLSDNAPRVTGSNIVGTPAYLAPEQAEEGIQIPAMDIYSLGVTLFEVFTGEIPYMADTPIAQILMHVQRPVPSVRILNPKVTPETDRVIKRAMAKRPKDRFSTATALAEALESTLFPVPLREIAAEGEPTPVSLPEIDFTVAAQASAESDEAQAEPAGRFRLRLPWNLNLSADPMVLLWGAVGLFVLVIAGILLRAALAAPAEASLTPAPTALVAGQPTDLPALILPSPSPSSSPSPQPPTEPAAATPTPTDAPPPTEAVEPTPLPATLDLGGTRMILVAGAEFVMGSRLGLRNERPEHPVVIEDYYLDITEVTIGQYMACVDAAACQALPVVRSRTRSAYYGLEKYRDYPVINVTWLEAQAYCRWRGGHLPTEAQWEKAARWDQRAGESLEFPWGTRAVDPFYLNYGISGFGDTVKVGSYPDGASPYGVLDLAGNVAEWVYDWYQEDFYAIAPYADPVGPTEGDDKVYRGGSYATFGSELRAAARQFAPPEMRLETVGFRCAWTPGGDPTQQ